MDEPAQQLTEKTLFTSYGQLKPSTRLSGSAEQLLIIAKHRSAPPDRLHKLVRGDLDWIVMKALEKERARRYETADSFAADMRRFVNGEAIEARPPSAYYRLRKISNAATPADYLDQVCGGDQALRERVEALCSRFTSRSGTS